MPTRKSNINPEVRSYLLKNIKYFEGYEPKPYKDTQGIPTIGYGINLTDPANIEFIKKNTPYKVDQVLKGEVNFSEKYASRYVDNKINNVYKEAKNLHPNLDSYPAPVQNVILDLGYNMGTTKLAGFKNFNSALQKGNYSKAAEELKNSNYYNQTGRRAKSHYDTLSGLAGSSSHKRVLSASSAPEPGYFEKFMTGYNAPFNDPKTDYNFPTRFIGGLQEVFGVDTTQPVQKQKHGGRLTKEGKEARKRAPRTYNYPDPPNVTSGPMDQRGNPNLVFGAGGWTGYPDHTMKSSARQQFDDVRRLTKYADGGPIEPYNISDPAEFKKADRAYQDSLSLYNKYNFPGKVNYNYPISRNEDYLIHTNYFHETPEKARKEILNHIGEANAKFGKNGINPIGYNYEKFTKDNWHYPVFKNPVRKPVYTPEPEYNITQSSEPFGPQNMEMPTQVDSIWTPYGKMSRADYEKQFGSKVTERDLRVKKDDGGDVSQAQQEYIRNIGRNAATGSVTPLYGAKDPIFTIIGGAAGRVIPRMLSLIPFPAKPAATKSEQLPEIPRNRAVPPPHKGLELSPELEPYMSSTRRPATREEQVFESFLSPKRRAELDEERTTYYDSKGNIIPRPKKAKGGTVWSIVEDRPMAGNGLLVPPAGMFDTGVQRSDATNTTVQQSVQNTVAAKQFQSDLRNPRVTESQFKEKHGISREQYRNLPSNFDVAMNQVWQGAKEPFKFIGADPDLIRENPNAGIPQALAGTLMLELPVDEMYQATKQGISGIKKALGKRYKEVPTITTPIDVSRNLEDLNAAQKFAEQYGYELPANLERISQSNVLTDRTIRGLMDRHNTFVRGVSTNWEELAKRNPEILRHLEGKGFDLSTKEGTKAAAEYMATHIPINTGYGRASLDTEVLNEKNMEGLYTSNSIPTAEGYTYGQGYITKVKKPTNFSSSNRQDWINKNNPSYVDEDEFRHINYYNTEELGDYALGIFRNENPKYITLDEKLNAVKKRFDRLTKNLDLNNSKQVEYLKDLTEDFEKINKFKNVLGKSKYDLNLIRTERSKEPTDPFAFLQRKEGSAEGLLYFLKAHPYQEKMKEIHRLGESLTKYSWDKQQLIRDQIDALTKETSKIYKEAIQDYMKMYHPDYDPVNRYAHYIHLGTPGQKVLEPIKSWEVTPEIWKNKSRSHSNSYSKKLSTMNKGGQVTWQIIK